MKNLSEAEQLDTVFMKRNSEIISDDFIRTQEIPLIEFGVQETGQKFDKDSPAFRKGH